MEVVRPRNIPWVRATELWRGTTVFVNADKKGERRQVLLLFLVVVGVCMGQIVSGAGNMLDLEKDMDGNQ